MTVFVCPRRRVATQALAQNPYLCTPIHSPYSLPPSASPPPLRRTAPIGLAAVYCHPVEMVLANLVPLSLPAYVLRTPVPVFLLWSALGIAGTVGHHCGYGHADLFRYLPFVPTGLATAVDQHDKHHELFHYNFGLLSYLDQACGTSDPELPARQKATAASSPFSAAWLSAERWLVWAIGPAARGIARGLGLKPVASRST